MSKPGKEIASRYAPPIIFIIASIIYALPLLLKWGYIGVGDWELFVTMAAVPAKTILHFHQFPFWNPYLGGGNILFAHPEVGVLSPFFLLILLFGPIAGLKLMILAAYFLGFLGTYLFSRTLGLSRYSSYLVAFAYFGSTYFGSHFSIGHIPFTHFCFLPWFLYFLLKSSEDGRFIFGAILSIALIVIGNGAAVPFLYTVFFSGLFIILYSCETRSFRYIKAYLLSIVLGLLLASVKVIPMYYYLSQNQWPGMPEDHTPLALLTKIFFSLNQALFQQAGSGQYWGWHEYSAYISPLIIILAACGLVCKFRKCLIWLILLVFFFLFGLGNFGSFSPWALITHLPGFESIRSPARAFQFAILAVAIMSGFGLDYFLATRRWTDSIRRIIALSVVGLVLVSNFLINLPNFETIAYKKPRIVEFDDEFRHVIGRKDNIYNLFLRNRGSLVAPWLSAYRESRGLVTAANEVMMEYVITGQARILKRNYTPNRVEYGIEPIAPGTIIFGIGYDNGWSAADGRPVYENNGLVATDFRLTDNRLILKYRAPFFILGLIVSLGVLALCLLFFVNRNLGERLKAVLN
jgi:hypothetical protein